MTVDTKLIMQINYNTHVLTHIHCCCIDVTQLLLGNFLFHARDV